MHQWSKPPASVLWRAIEIYLRHAYDGPPNPQGLPAHTPSAVRTRLEVLRGSDPRDLYDCSIFERDIPANPTKYSLRLGNRSYPHMKLSIDRAPDGRTYLLRADTHDNHVRPKPGSRDEKPFLALMQQNHVVAESIEADWEQAGLPTFKNFLRKDLERRAAEANAAAATGLKQSG